MSRPVSEQPGDDPTPAGVVATPPEQIDPDATVKHYDQLTERAQRAVAAAAAGCEATVPASDLSPDDVVRYTGYFVVQ
jgi:hypothetical protein